MITHKGDSTAIVAAITCTRKTMDLTRRVVRRTECACGLSNQPAKCDALPSKNNADARLSRATKGLCEGLCVFTPLVYHQFKFAARTQRTRVIKSVTGYGDQLVNLDGLWQPDLAQFIAS